MFPKISKLLFSLFVFGVATSTVNAIYSISTPGTGVTWNAGQNVNVAWTGTDEPVVDVRLVYGAASNLQLFAVICNNVNSADGTCSYTVADNIPSGINYAVTVGKDPNNFGYSSYFTIQSQGSLPAPTGCPNMGGNNCTASLPCCSSSGYCGSTDAYCGTGCQAKYSFNGVCGTSSQPPPTTTSKTPSSPTTPSTPSTKHSPSPPRQAKCGSTTCTSKSPCCSKYNHCGKTSAFCGTGCQPGKSFAGKCVAPKKRSLEKRAPRDNDDSSAYADALRQLGRADCHDPKNNLIICQTIPTPK